MTQAVVSDAHTLDIISYIKTAAAQERAKVII